MAFLGRNDAVEQPNVHAFAGVIAEQRVQHRAERPDILAVEGDEQVDFAVFHRLYLPERGLRGFRPWFRGRRAPHVSDYSRNRSGLQPEGAAAFSGRCSTP